MKSDTVTKGKQQAPHRSLLNALGLTPEEMERPLVGIVSSYNEIVPGHMNLDKIVDAVSPKGSTTLALSPGGAITLRSLKVSLDGIIDILNSSLDIAASSAVSVRSCKVVSDIQNKTSKTQHLSSARVISKN